MSSTQTEPRAKVIGWPAPLGAPSMAGAVRAGAEVYAALCRQLTERKLSTGLGDEGGFAPELTKPEEVLRLLADAISDAGYPPGRSTSRRRSSGRPTGDTGSPHPSFATAWADATA